jgi:hypothetical protein
MIEQSSDKLRFRFKDDVARTLPYATLQVGIKIARLLWRIELEQRTNSKAAENTTIPSSRYYAGTMAPGQAKISWL